jgi:hypothetical protein
MKKTTLIFAVLFALFLIPLISATDISSCQNITSSGEYVLTANLSGVQASLDRCIDIYSDDVVLDCQGYEISDNATDDYGIYAWASSKLNNLTIKNCIVYNYDEADVYIFNVSNAVINNNTLTGLISPYTPGYGVKAHYVSNVNVTDNVLRGVNGLTFLYDTEGNNAASNILIDNNNFDGSEVGLKGYYQNSRITNNQITNGIHGIILQGNSSNNYIANNDISNQYNFGIQINSWDGSVYLYSSNNTIINNTFNNNGISPFGQFVKTSNVTIINNIVNDNPYIFYQCYELMNSTINSNYFNYSSAPASIFINSSNSFYGNYWSLFSQNPTACNPNIYGMCRNPLILASGNADYHVTTTLPENLRPGTKDMILSFTTFATFLPVVFILFIAGYLLMLLTKHGNLSAFNIKDVVLVLVISAIVAAFGMYIVWLLGAR